MASGEAPPKRRMLYRHKMGGCAASFVVCVIDLRFYGYYVAGDDRFSAAYKSFQLFGLN